MKAVGIIQARMGSSRFPGKVLQPILGRPMLWHIVRRVCSVQLISEVIVATSDQVGDEPIRKFCAGSGIPFFAGSERDVLDRFYQAATAYSAEVIVRVTADCPLVDPRLAEELIHLYSHGEYDHVGIATGAGAIFLEKGRFPDGLDAECFSFHALQKAWNEAKDPLDREHVTSYIWRNKDKFRCGSLTSEKDYSTWRWTVDNPEDFLVIGKVFEELYPANPNFGMQDVLLFFKRHPQWREHNQSFVGQEGYHKLWEVKESPA